LLHPAPWVVIILTNFYWNQRYTRPFFYQAKEGPGTENKKVLENACGVRDSGGEMYVSIYT